VSLRVAFHSLGCKLNQLETESLADAFRASGAAIAGSRAGSEVEEDGARREVRDDPAEDSCVGADLVIVNTCTVTSKAEQKARRIARAALTRNPGAAVLLTGCYAEMGERELEALGERVIVVPGTEKDAILELGAWLAENWQGHGELDRALREWRAGLGGRATDRFAYKPERFGFHSRPALKVQDGCDNRCSYCRVCLARGRSSSLPAAEALERARALEERGAAEIVLTGVNLSQYDDEGRGFAELVRLLLEGTERVAYRLSSFEPDRVDEAFLEVFSERRVRPHAHLPIQSGSDPILARMARPYRRDRVLGAVVALRRARKDPFLACDLITGFPGETEADFEATLDLARECGFAWIHAFPFSARPGTKAWDMRPRVPERIAGERVGALTALARAGKAAYAARWIGEELEAVVEAGGAEPRGTAENYLKLRFEGSCGDQGAASGRFPSPGTAIRCRILEALGSGSEEARALILSTIA